MGYTGSKYDTEVMSLVVIICMHLFNISLNIYWILVIYVSAHSWQTNSWTSTFIHVYLNLRLCSHVTKGKVNFTTLNCLGPSKEFTVENATSTINVYPNFIQNNYSYCIETKLRGFKVHVVVSGSCEQKNACCLPCKLFRMSPYQVLVPRRNYL